MIDRGTYTIGFILLYIERMFKELIQSCGFSNLFIILISLHDLFSYEIPPNVWDTLFGESHLSLQLPSKYNNYKKVNSSQVSLIRRERNPEWEGDESFTKFYSRCREILIRYSNGINSAKKIAQIPNSLFTICQLKFDVLKILTNGAQLAIDECKFNFKYRRWNCPTFLDSTHSLFGEILNLGIKEKAFVYAITSSALSYSIIKACRKGHILNGHPCGCDNKESSATPFKLNDQMFRINSRSNYRPPTFSFLTRKPEISSLQTSKMGPYASIIKNITEELESRRSFEPSKLKPYESKLMWNNIKRLIGINYRNEKIQKSRRDTTFEKAWIWGGCSDDLGYGQKISKLVMGAFEQSNLPESKMNIHNIRCGRKILKSTTEIACKCHGVSGSCSSKICWKTLPSFRVISARMIEKFDGAIKVDKTFFLPKSKGYAHDKNNTIYKLRRHADRIRSKKMNYEREKSFWVKPTKKHLIYFEESPDFCNQNPNISSIGTKGRICNPNSLGLNGCELLCCGRGFEEKKEILVESDCRCSFKWCCRVECQACISHTNNYYCT